MFRVRDAAAADFPALAAMAVDSEIGRRYGFEVDSLSGKLAAAAASGAIVLVAEAGRGADADLGRDGPPPAASGSLLGFAWVEPRGAFGSSPYLKLIAVAQEARSAGAGAALLSAYEVRTAGQGRLWTLLVSDFNLRAQVFYERHGYRAVGRLPGFALAGVDEVLMVKEKP